MRLIRSLFLLLLAIPAWGTQQQIMCAPGTPCGATGPTNTLTGDKLWDVGFKLNSMFTDLYGNDLGFTSRFSSQIYVAASGDITGVTDLADIQAAAAQLASSFRLPPLASSFYPALMIQLGPGTFYFTQANIGLLPNTPRKMQGFWLAGSGKGVTSIDYNPIASGPMLNNQDWLDVKMSSLTFLGHDANSDFMWAQEQASLSNIQDNTFEDVEWAGSWRTLFRLTGGNNNSEWKFDRDTVSGTVTNWIYTPPSVSTTITNGSASISATNTASQVQIGDTGVFTTSVTPMVSGTSYYVVAATTSSFQVATSAGGTPIIFTGGGSPSFTTASDQFLNFWFDKCKFWTGTSPGQWINMSYGGSIKIRDSDMSNHQPASVSYAFNLLAALGGPHFGGVMNFEVDGLRVEHAGTNSRLIHSQWTNGSISFNNLDESSQAGRWPITNAYAFYEIINNNGPTIEYRNSQLMGVHNYVNNVANFQRQNGALYEGVTLLENPTAANFITNTNLGNSGGLERIRFVKSRNNVSSATTGYHEVVDTDINWNKSAGGQTDSKVTSCVGSNSDFSFNGGNTQIRFPMNAMITRIRYWNPLGSIGSGAYEYTIQTTESTPTVLAGGPATPMAGANAAIALPASSMYSVTPNFVMTTDQARTIEVIDTLPRGSAFTGMYCLIDYIGSNWTPANDDLFEQADSRRVA